MNKTLLISLGAVVVLAVVGGVFWMMTANQPASNNIQVNPMNVTSGENPQPGSTVHDLPVEPAAAVARKDLAAKLGMDEKSIVILQITETTWNDGCLGLGGIAESCLQALVPGFRVEMLANGKTYFYRTDATGAAVRAE